MIATLKARTTLWNVLVVASALGLFATLLYAWLAQTLYAHHDGDLQEEARRVVATLSSNADPMAALQTLDKQGAVAPYLMVRDAHGQMVFRSARLAQVEPDIGAHEVLTHAAARGATTEQFFTVSLARGPVRFTCVPLARPDGTYLQLGRPLGDVGMMLEVVAVASAALIPIVILVTSFGGFLIAKRALRPIDSIATALESIQATDLSRRVDLHAPDLEVRRLTGSVNQLLDRLNTSFNTMKEFTADVSHQLQTPLTVMKGTIETARESQPAEAQPVFAVLSDEVNALSATLQDLRDLALADADSAGSRQDPVSVSEVFAEAGELVGALAEAHGVSCRTTIEPGLKVWGNAVRLRQLLLNLGENAVEFTPPGGTIRIDARRDQGTVVATVSDSGDGIPADLLPHVFDRHVHGRSQTSQARSGLGLAIVKRIVDAHGGNVVISSRPGAGTTASITLPMANPMS
ncbi:MAG: HAMP domain-containing sensor histidine kinase [Vicinamibacterales bacterium]|jgi:signal transduction histidine kinase